MKSIINNTTLALDLIKDEYKENTIIHIPHSSTHFPDKNGFNEELLKIEIDKLTDWHTDKIFKIDNVKIIKSNFSRMFCDVERLPDEDEEMFRFGRGFYYTKTDLGETLRIESETHKKHVKENYYDVHHKKLSEAVNTALEKAKMAYILDCHSFSDIPFESDIDKSPNRPDICIGVDEFHTPDWMVKLYTKAFENEGYNVEVNRPYEGTIVPLEHYRKNDNVKSIMVEVNRKLYLNDDYSMKEDEVRKLNSIINTCIKGY